MNAKKEICTTAAAPVPAGPYSQAILFERLVITSGQTGVDPETGKLVPDGIAEETKQALKNLECILQESGSSWNQVLKATIFLKDMNDFHTVNKVYSELFDPPFPARSCFAVAGLPLGALVEIEVVAFR